jgi:hypothetical protein
MVSVPHPVGFKGDNVTVLRMLGSLRPASASDGLGLIARELGLDIAGAIYTPDVAVHIPGATIMLADELSRKIQP